MYKRSKFRTRPIFCITFLMTTALCGCSDENDAGERQPRLTQVTPWPAPAASPSVSPTAPPTVAPATLTISEFSLDFPRRAAVPVEQRGSSHEITFDSSTPTAMWVTSPKYDGLAKVALNGTRTYYDMPIGTEPHGEEFDRRGNLILSFEGTEQIAKFDPRLGQIVATWDIHVDPHGLAIGSDGETIWFTGKTANTVGKIAPDGRVTNYALPTSSALPIYVRPGPDGNMWVTELTGNKIARVTPNGTITEFTIPTPNSRPIAIVPDPRGRGMLFSQEAGNNVAFIDRNGDITEYAVPKSQANLILGGLAFDSAGNLWVQQYLNLNSPIPDGVDSIVRVDKSILGKTPAQMTSADFAFFTTPTRSSVLHRIVQGPDGNMWYTALKADVVGKVSIPPGY